MSDATYIEHSPWRPIISFSATFGVFIVAVCLAFWWYQWKMVRPFSRFPSKRLDVECMLPIILGRFPKYVSIRNFAFQVLLKAANSFREEGLCVVWFIKPYVLVYNEEFMKSLVNEIELTDKGTAFESNKIIFGSGLLASKHEISRVHRKLLNPAFSVGVLKGKMLSMNKYALELVERLEKIEDKPDDDVWDVLKHCSFQNMADFVLGLKLNNEKHVSMAENFMKIADLAAAQFIEKVTSPWLRWDFTLPLFQSGRKYLEIANECKSQVREIMKELTKKDVFEKEHRNDGSPKVASSCADILMKLYLDRQFTKQDVLDELLTFTSAGYETVSVTMLWCLYTLGHHPRVQEKAYKEVQSIVPEGDITYEDLAKLKYLECAIKETMRLYTTIPIDERRARTDIQCGKYTIPKGASVCFVPFVMHRDADIFPEPENFDPDRFSDTSKLRPWMYVPFGEGLRKCIGKRFAMMEMKVQLSYILRRFRITSLNKMEDSELDWAITLKPTKPLRFEIESRTTKD